MVVVVVIAVEALRMRGRAGVLHDWDERWFIRGRRWSIIITHQVICIKTMGVLGGVGSRTMHGAQIMHQFVCRCWSIPTTGVASTVTWTKVIGVALTKLIISAACSHPTIDMCIHEDHILAVTTSIAKSLEFIDGVGKKIVIPGW